MAKKIYQTFNQLGLRTSVMAVASCLALSGVPLAAQAAGLGRIVVFSALGQPLRAEIDVSATREELSDMKAQLASPETFKQTGLDYATTLLDFRFSLDKRSNGQSVIKLSSDRPVNDPFVDMLLELNWPAGRLVREYTFLLDPPEDALRGSPVPVAPASASASARSAAANKSPEVRRATTPIDDDLRGKAIAQVRSQESGQKPANQSARKSVEQPAEGRDFREVKRGDTLHKIASETKPEGVSLEQMLVGLLRANQDAFDGGNMNRLKTGKILSVPEKSAIEAVSPGEAKKVVVAQSSDWNAYRTKLAGVAAQTPVANEAAKQEATGKITAKVEDKATPAAEPKDQLKVTKTAKSGSTPSATAKRSDEDLIAKEKALKEANERQADLEKTVAKLQSLIELKNQNLAELQKQAAAKAASAETKIPVEESRPSVSVPPPVVVATTAAPEVPPAKVEPAIVAIEKPAEKLVEPSVVQPTAKPEEVKPEPNPAETPKPVVVPPPLPEEPGFVDELLANPLALAGGAGILALIAAFLFARRRRAGKGESPLDLSSTLSPHSNSLTANSVFRNTGGQSVDTSHTPAQTDFSQAGPGSIDTDEVDPVAEADVYMAYGRDAQAEEILVEARQKDPKRYAILLKLLEIYSNRKDLKQFETLATDLYSETGGVGADWEKAAAMGLKLDPDNPLFGASSRATPATFDADATVIVSSKSMKNTVTLPGQLSKLAEVASTVKTPPVAVVPVVSELTSLDFDLGLGDDTPSTSPGTFRGEVKETRGLQEPVLAAGTLDFDLGSNSAGLSNSAVNRDASLVGLDFNFPDISGATANGAGTKKDGPADLDFDLGIESVPITVVTEYQSTTTYKSSDVPTPVLVEDDGVEFDVSLTESTFLGRSMPDASSFDMSSIDLDLQEPELEIPAIVHHPVAEVDTVLDSSFDSIQVSTAVNPDFATEQAETVVNPQFGVEQDLIPEHDFSTVQAETLVNPQFGVKEDLAPEFDISASEEVTTKLDLAKAYEEMGDFEGARELLQEVMKEGDAAQREKAQAIFAKIGE